MNALLFTVDVEPDWGVSGTRAVREELPRLLDMLDERGIRATFFVSGAMVQPCREVLGRIGPQHELASHGQEHRRMDSLPREAVRRELCDSREAVASLGREVLGVRAPFFATPPWWCEEAAAAGYRYDASAGRTR